MKTFSTRYQKGAGWAKELPHLDSSQTLVLVFGSSSFINYQKPFRELKEHFPQSVIAGCSTAGEILDDELFDGSLVVSITRFDDTKIRYFTTPVDSIKCSFSAGQKVAEHLEEEDLSGILILSDGLNVNGTDLAKGINSKITDKTSVTGGLAGDGAEFIRTWILVDGIPETQYVGGIGFYGNAVKIDHGSSGGWKKFGPERMVTKAIHNVVYELDGKPALELYKNYLGGKAEGLPEEGLRYPISFARSDSAKRLVRSILAIDEDDQSLTFGGDVPQGRTVSLMFATFENLVKGAGKSAIMTSVHTDADEEVLAIAISCIGRRLLMGDPSAELEATLENLPEHTSQVGFYSYGELSPCNEDNEDCILHNQTMTLTTIHE